MIFWTVVFITYYAASLVRGNLFFDIMKKHGELTLKQAQTIEEKEKETIGKEILKISWKMLLVLLLIIAEGIYLVNAFGVDIYKYPTIFTIFYLLFSTFVFNRNNKPKCDLKTDEGRVRYEVALDDMKRFTVKGFITSTIYLSYFGYMFYLLVLR